MTEEKDRESRPKSKLAEKMAKRKAAADKRLQSLDKKLSSAQRAAARANPGSSGQDVEQKAAKSGSVSETKPANIKSEANHKGSAAIPSKEVENKSGISASELKSRESKIGTKSTPTRSPDVKSVEQSNSTNVPGSQGNSETGKKETQVSDKDAGQNPVVSGRAPPKPKPSSTISPMANKPMVGGIKSPGFGNKETVSPAHDLRKIIEFLSGYEEVAVARGYLLQFLSLLRGYEQSSVVFAFYFDTVPDLISVDEGSSGNDLPEWLPASAKFVSSLESELNDCRFLAMSVADLGELDPKNVFNMRKHIDIHVFVDDSRTDIAKFIERVSHGSHSIVATTEDNADVLNACSQSIEYAMGYQVSGKKFDFKNDAFNLKPGLSDLQDLLMEPSVRKSLKEFALQRQISLIADSMDRELSAQIAVFQDAEARSEQELDSSNFDFEIADSLISKMQKNIEGVLNSKGFHLDKNGNIKFSKTVNEKEAAQGLVSELSLNDLLREDELNEQLFTSEENKLISRIKRFRFASKLGYLWKLRPEYVDKLHGSTQNLLVQHATDLQRQVFNIVDTTISKLGVLQSRISSSNPLYKKLESLKKNAWSQDSVLIDIVKDKSDLNHFRSEVYSKRGGATPLEKEGGVLKELRDSRMFVSQLMAFGMLGAIVLGSTFAIDVLFSWFAGGSGNFGEELQEAAQSSRGLGRQVRVMIMGLAGISILIYLALKIYLRKSEQLIERSQIVEAYASQLEDSIAKQIIESANLTKEVIGIQLKNFAAEYNAIRDEFNLVERSGMESIRDNSSGVRANSLGGKSHTKRLEELHKWLIALTRERESLSIIQRYKQRVAGLEQEMS